MARPKKNTNPEAQDKKMQEMAAEESMEVNEAKDAEAAAPAEDVAEKKSEKVSETTFTQEQVQAMIAEAVAKATAKIHRDAGDEMVTLLYLAEVSSENTLILPGYGTLRPHSYLDVPKKEFGSKFMSALARKLIERRHLLVVDGLSKEERERWGCDYKSGEVLDERTFDRMLSYPTEEICDIFRHLCREHREFVAKRFIGAHEKGDNRVSLSKVQALNEISKEDGIALFQPIIEAYKKDM